MVGGHETLLFVAPLEQWEIDNPQALELILVHESQLTAHLQTQGAELYACLVGVVAGEDEDKVALLGLHLVGNSLQLLGGVELIDA